MWVYRINAAGIVGAYRFDGRGIAALHVVEDSLVGAGWDYDRIRFVKWSLNEVLKTSFIEDGPYYEGRRINNASNHTATTVGDSLLIWNFQTGATLCKVLGHTQYPSPFFRISALAFVPGGEFILTGQRIYNTLKLWNLRNGRFVEEFHFDQRVEAIACASNGIVCVGLNDGQVCFLRFNNLSSQSGQLDL
ncbi:WD40 repeat domain-containing [Paramuricea clavata]|uniref:WD40 repeat domain-containing n=1 Tax=Paramuricea clavata TaxID=317549 RepID=A0A7D9J5X4_PARCT|nr:WD40 repeat domain-containing [Paramuricea clavata]